MLEKDAVEAGIVMDDGGIDRKHRGGVWNPTLMP